jgi:excisionase family DNA binding protein
MPLDRVFMETEIAIKTWLTLEEVANYLCFSKEKVYILLKQNQIPAIKVGRHWRFNKNQIDEWLIKLGGKSTNPARDIMPLERDTSTSLLIDANALKNDDQIKKTHDDTLIIPDDISKTVIMMDDMELEGDKSSNIKIDKAFVHKKLEENVLIAHPKILDSVKNIYRTKIIAELNHPFFFDHPLGHLPGILLLEAVRQFGTSLSHIYFNTPFGVQFILHEINSKFIAGAISEQNTFIDGIVTDIVMRRGVLRKMKGTAYIHQHKQIIGEVSSSWSIIPDDVLSRIDKKFL